MTEEDVLTEEDLDTFFLNPGEDWDEINVVMFGDGSLLTSVLDKDGEMVPRVQKLDMTIEVMEPFTHGSFFRILTTPDGKTLTRRSDDGERFLIVGQVVNVKRVNIFKYEDSASGREEAMEDWPNAGRQDADD